MLTGQQFIESLRELKTVIYAFGERVPAVAAFSGMLVERFACYHRHSAAVPVEDRYRLLRLLENMTGGTALAESMHSAGSPQAQRVMILRQGNLPAKAALARHLAGITPCARDCGHGTEAEGSG